MILNIFVDMSVGRFPAVLMGLLGLRVFCSVHLGSIQIELIPLPCHVVERFDPRIFRQRFRLNLANDLGAV